MCIYKGQAIPVKWKSPKTGPTEPMEGLNLKTVRYKVGGDVVVWDIKADEPEKTEVRSPPPSPLLSLSLSLSLCSSFSACLLGFELTLLLLLT